jgi:hypothetical protein
MTKFREAFPDVRVTPAADFVAEGDYVVGRWVGGGTHAGPIFLSAAFRPLLASRCDSRARPFCASRTARPPNVLAGVGFGSVLLARHRDNRGTVEAESDRAFTTRGNNGAFGPFNSRLLRRRG